MQQALVTGSATPESSCFPVPVLSSRSLMPALLSPPMLVLFHFLIPALLSLPVPASSSPPIPASLSFPMPTSSSCSVLDPAPTYLTSSALRIFK